MSVKRPREGAAAGRSGPSKANAVPAPAASNPFATTSNLGRHIIVQFRPGVDSHDPYPVFRWMIEPGAEALQQPHDPNVDPSDNEGLRGVLGSAPLRPLSDVEWAAVIEKAQSASSESRSETTPKSKMGKGKQHNASASGHDYVGLFFDYVFEQQPLVVRRHHVRPDYYHPSPAALASGKGAQHLSVQWSSEAMRRTVAITASGAAGGSLDGVKILPNLTGKPLCYTTDINVVRFDYGLRKRVPLKSVGEVTLSEYDAFMASGQWSIRFLRPQEHVQEMSLLMSAMDDELGCNMGCNSYWTPHPHGTASDGGLGAEGKQGFAPHYDDVDVWLCQLEGAKVWRLYAPLEPTDVLARYGSKDYDPKTEIPKRPLYEVMLRPGDLLYLPRGWIHQGVTPPLSVLSHLPPGPAAYATPVGMARTHPEGSLHVTFSAYQLMTEADLLHSILRTRVERLAALQEGHPDPSLRRTVPVGWWWALGTASNAKLMGPYRALTAKRMTRGVEVEEQEEGGGNDASVDATDAAFVSRATTLRASMLASVREHLKLIVEDLYAKDGAIDRGADDLAKEVVAKRQPPALVTEAGNVLPMTSALVKQGVRSKSGNRVAGGATTAGGGSDATVPTLTLDSYVKITGPFTSRVVIDNEYCCFHHSGCNSSVVGAAPVKFGGMKGGAAEGGKKGGMSDLQSKAAAAAAGATMLKLDITFAPALVLLVTEARRDAQRRQVMGLEGTELGGKWIQVKDLPMPDNDDEEAADEEEGGDDATERSAGDDNRMSLVQALLETGCLLVRSS